jgi:sulfoxide reductase catalytic subunit YedY
MRDWMKMAGIHSSEITDREVFKQRRQLIRASMAAGVTGLIGEAAWADSKAFAITGSPSKYSTDEEPTSRKTITSYNNFSELGRDKGDPVRNADRLETDPWSVVIDGECEMPGTYNLEDILKPHDIEERIYRLRCVEAWSMVIPWNGFPLADLIKRFKPTSKAAYVAFETLNDKDLPGMRGSSLDWPYREGLRMDEAMHPLALMAIGIYGDEIPNQNGAPMRLVVPWKYGYKSIKSIVRISFVEKQPPTTWNMLQPSEYGFFSNVNPDVSHPRWSQAKERRLSGDVSGLAALFTPKIKTKSMNGYGTEVASLYKDMDLKKYF